MNYGNIKFDQRVPITKFELPYEKNFASFGQ